MTWSCRVPDMKVSNLFWSITDMVRVFPRIVFHSIAFPSDQVLQLASEHPTVQDLFHDILLFAIHKFWRWRRRLAIPGGQCSWFGKPRWWWRLARPLGKAKDAASQANW